MLSARTAAKEVSPGWVAAHKHDMEHDGFWVDEIVDCGGRDSIAKPLQLLERPLVLVI